MFARIPGRLLLLLGALLICAGCSMANQPNPNNVAVVEPTALVTPEPDKAVVTGQLIDANSGQPVGNVVVRLAEIYWDEGHTKGALALDESNSPSTIADAQGFFTFKNVVPRDYSLVLRNRSQLDASADVIVPEQPGANKALIITAAKGEVKQLGQVRARSPE